jgi:hypothetical protein
MPQTSRGTDDLLAVAGLPDHDGPHAVLRRDWSDVVYLVAKDLSAEAAAHLVAHFNGLGHHQVYWAEERRADLRGLLPGDMVPG